jgi:energy-converting hydrogenase Eha subunit E
MASFDITISNLTNAQPLSPAAIIAHQDGYAVFSIGAPATTGLEEMAEGGDNTALLAEADADAMVTVTGSGAAAIGPAASETVTIDMLESDLPGLRISVATMLVNTNDAFTGLNAMSVEAMATSDVISMHGFAYDAGTEADSEAAATIPGPAGGGEGFNAARDDQADQVTMHAGVVSQDDGFATSDLGEQHRFDNPVVRVRIERTD